MISISNLPTYYGNLSYSIKKEDNKYIVSLSGTISLPEGGIHFRNPIEGKLNNIKINKKEVNTFNEKEILINEFPATIEINY
jgi:hypothetical protein